MGMPDNGDSHVDQAIFHINELKKERDKARMRRRESNRPDALRNSELTPEEITRARRKDA